MKKNLKKKISKSEVKNLKSIENRRLNENVLRKMKNVWSREKTGNDYLIDSIVKK